MEIVKRIISNKEFKSSFGKKLHKYICKYIFLTCSCQSHQTIGKGKTKTIICNTFPIGRYVTVRLPNKKTHLTLCEVQVFEPGTLKLHNLKLNLNRCISFQEMIAGLKVCYTKCDKSGITI